MNKVGIITMYYKSHNYGGILQSYALQKILEINGIDSEQICYKMDAMLSPKRKLYDFLYYLKHIKQYINFKVKQNLKLRYKALEKFGENQIKHSKQVYSDSEILQANDVYSAFITGSDQVWANSVPAYFLDFVSKDKKKISYAASISKNSLNYEEKEHFKKALPTYLAVSVRENAAVDLISPYYNKKVEQVLDPVLLLSRKDWNKVCSTSKIVPDEKYIFCYFLGNDVQARELITEYARVKGLPIYTMPYLQGYYRVCDVDFGDEKLFDVDPADFVALIKNAEYILTDSFHACAFSAIYDKNFVAFDRIGSVKMGSRIETLLDIFACKNKFCDNDSKRTVGYIDSVIGSRVDYSKYDELKKHSYDFLFDALNKC